MSTFVSPAQADAVDPFLWLEDVEGERALEWVRERNEESGAALGEVPATVALQTRLKQIFDSTDRIPHVAERSGLFYNFWTDAEHPRGLWRRTTLESYQTAAPDWEVLIDLDALGAAEGINWVWHGVSCDAPTYSRCMVGLSRGGADADVKREFDLHTLTFVDGGFELDEAKSAVEWIDADTLLVMTDTGEGSLTASGYPRTTRVWHRGTPFAESKLVFEGDTSDIAAGVYRTTTPGYERCVAYRQITFFTGETYLLDDAWATTLVPKPDHVRVSFHHDHVYFVPRKDWLHAGTTFVAGSLLRAPLDPWMTGAAQLEVLFAPDARSSLEDWGFTKNHIYLNILRDVKSSIEILTPTANGWARAPLAGVADIGQLEFSPLDADSSDAYFLVSTDFLTPSTLSYGIIGEAAPNVLKTLPPLFDAAGLRVDQHFVTSVDGTRVPYFEIGRTDRPDDGTTPTILYGYGGFEVSLKPAYSAHLGAGWLERGGTYVIANIRGGGEYGPSWHQAALKDKRHRAYEDFVAVADDLVARGVTRPEKLGTMGGSNGGLLMGNMYTQYPERFGAVVCQVPLLDMKRYTKLLAGASWEGEYGDPDDPDQWAYIRTFSPYHLIDEQPSAPPILFTTSTRDDRVHPGHARKMAAALLQSGRSVTYYENLEGGHGGAADNGQAAYMRALAYTFLWRELAGG